MTQPKAGLIGTTFERPTTSQGILHDVLSGLRFDKTLKEWENQSKKLCSLKIYAKNLTIFSLKAFTLNIYRKFYVSTKDANYMKLITSSPNFNHIFNFFPLQIIRTLQWRLRASYSPGYTKLSGVASSESSH